jgi:FixJ family two-component response regulator
MPNQSLAPKGTVRNALFSKPWFRPPVLQGAICCCRAAKLGSMTDKTPDGSLVRIDSEISSMSDGNATILIVDDDAELRASLGRLLSSLGLETRLYASIPEFLQSSLPDGPTCLVLDVRLPERSGLDLQKELSAANSRLPIVFITGHADVPMSVQAMKLGAIEFLTKPFREQDLLDAIQAGLTRDAARREEDRAIRILRDRFDSLSPREREIMIQVVQGRLSKQIAGDIGVTDATVKVHRSNLMRKMRVRSLADLARIADKLNLTDAQRSPG